MRQKRFPRKTNQRMFHKFLMDWLNGSKGQWRSNVTMTYWIVITEKQNVAFSDVGWIYCASFWSVPTSHYIVWNDQELAKSGAFGDETMVDFKGQQSKPHRFPKVTCTNPGTELPPFQRIRRCSLDQFKQNCFHDMLESGERFCSSSGLNKNCILNWQNLAENLFFFGI